MPLFVLPYPVINPVLVEIGPFPIRWYALAYIAGLIGGWWLARRIVARESFWGGRPRPDAASLDDLLVYAALGVVIGGRLGYCLFYKPAYYLAHPLEILYVWQGGMSFHGGMLGVIVSQWWFARSRGKPFWQLMDLIAPCVPLGLAAGRVGNFINGELWGRAADPSLPWAMVFPQSGSAIARHPSQVYQFLLEGVLLFVVLWLYARRQRREGQVAAAFLIGYGILRFVAEYFREPDSHLGLLSFGLSMGQWLCIPMVVAGVLLWAWFGRRPAPVPAR